MNGGRPNLDLSGAFSWLRRGWQNRGIRYVTLLVILLGLIGSEFPFAPYDWAQKTVTAKINAKPYRGDAVIVEIDTRTMEGLGQPRLSDDDLARLIQKIGAAKPRQIFIGRIRQRVPGHETSLALLSALRQVSPKPVLFVQLVPKDPFEFNEPDFEPEKSDQVLDPPKLDPRLAEPVVQASEVTFGTLLGAPLLLPPTVKADGKVYPSMAQLMAGQNEPNYKKHEVDVSYDPSTIKIINAIDVLNNEVSASNKLTGRQVVIYSNSDGLRDNFVNPHGWSDSPAALSILAAQTLVDGPPQSIGWLPSYILAVLSIYAWMFLRSGFGRLIVFSAFFVILLSPVFLDRYLVFQETSNAVFLMIFVAIGRQWSKFRANLALARSAAETKSWFLAQASHDLRQPIHAIGMLAARLAQSDLTPAQAELTSRIDRSIDGANRMLQSLLDLATIESGSLKPKIVPVSVNALLAEIEEQSTLAAERAGVELRFVPSEAVILADRSLAAAMLQNVVSNAIKYATGKRVLIGPRRSGKRLSLCVYDVGMGISKEDMRHVQKEFFRVSSHKKGGVEGTGLGLAIVHRLANLLSLTFTLRSTPGKGTSAIISGFKLTTANVVSVTAAQSNVMRPLTGLRVLLADDDTDSLRATEALLEQWGCEVSAYEAFPKLEAKFDIIVSDFDFGKGHTLADHRLEVDKLSRDGVTTIVLSGHHPDAVHSAMECDSLLVLAKPVRPAELRSVLMASRSAALTR